MQTIKFFISPLIIVTLIAGCATSDVSSPSGRITPGEVVKPQLMMIPASQAHYYANATPDHHADQRLQPDPRSSDAPPPAASSASVIQPAGVEAYPVARYVDPADPTVMHERHVVYRRTPAKWKLDAEPAKQIIVGPVLSDTQGQIPMVSQETDQFLREQQAINEANRRVLEALLGATKDLQEAEFSRRAAEAQAKKGQPNPPATTPSPAPAAAEQTPGSNQPAASQQNQVSS